MPSLTLEEALDMPYDQLARLNEAAERLRYYAMQDMANAVAFGVGLALSSKEGRREMPTWAELKERARRREEFLRSPFVVKGRKGLYGRTEPGA